MGVEMVFEALMISLMRGTPSVTFMLATPAKWNVFRVICVPGSPMLCAPKAPTVDPAGVSSAVSCWAASSMARGVWLHKRAMQSTQPLQATYSHPRDLVLTPSTKCLVRLEALVDPCKGAL